jgi:hypothetical protein
MKLRAWQERETQRGAHTICRVSDDSESTESIRRARELVTRAQGTHKAQMKQESPHAVVNCAQAPAHTRTHVHTAITCFGSDYYQTARRFVLEYHEQRPLMKLRAWQERETQRGAHTLCRVSDDSESTESIRRARELLTRARGTHEPQMKQESPHAVVNCASSTCSHQNARTHSYHLLWVRLLSDSPAVCFGVP